jgi:hypothetical protein
MQRRDFTHILLSQQRMQTRTCTASQVPTTKSILKKKSTNDKIYSLESDSALVRAANKQEIKEEHESLTIYNTPSV